MKKRTRTPDPTDEDVAMHLHDMSVSGKPQTEATARALKAMGKLSLDWFNAECERGTDPVVIVQAMIQSHVAVAHVIGGEISKLDEVTMIKVLGDAYRAAFISFAGHLEKYEQQQRKKASQP